MGMLAKQECLTCAEQSIVRYKWADFSSEKMHKPKACPEKDHKLTWVQFNWDGRPIIPDDNNRHTIMNVMQQVYDFREDWNHDDDEYYSVAYEFIMNSHDDPSQAVEKLMQIHLERYDSSEEFGRNLGANEHSINQYDGIFNYVDWEEYGTESLEDLNYIRLDDGVIYTWD